MDNFGAASVIALTGGWFAKNLHRILYRQNESMVNLLHLLVFTAPLIPPWAHTECERLTGTIENKSTCAPCSAALIVDISPARPPPTTIIFSLP